MTEDQQILADAANRLLGDLVEAAGLSPDEEALGAKVLGAFEEQGFLEVLVPEAEGGVGGGWADAGVLLHALGFHAAPGIAAETLLRRGLTKLCALDVPEPSAAPGPRGTIAGSAPLPAPRANDPMGDPVGLANAAMRAMQMAGCIEHVLAMTADYTKERVQFGRPLAKFQAIQQNLAELGGEAAAARRAADHALMTMDAAPSEPAKAATQIAAAKIRCGEAAGKAASIAHQAHGAIGFTHEHKLHTFTRRLWTWRAEAGSETFWARALGAQVLARGADAHWADLTAG